MERKILLLGLPGSGKGLLLSRISKNSFYDEEIEMSCNILRDGKESKVISFSKFGVDDFPFEDVENIVVLVRFTPGIEKSKENFRFVANAISENEKLRDRNPKIVCNCDTSTNRGLKLQAFDSIADEYNFERRKFLNIETDLNSNSEKMVICEFFSGK